MLLSALDRIYWVALKNYIDEEKGKLFLEQLLTNHGLRESEINIFFEYLNNLWDRGYSYAQLSQELSVSVDDSLFLLRHRKLNENIKQWLCEYSIGTTTLRKLLRWFKLESSDSDTLIIKLSMLWEDTKRCDLFSKQLRISNPTGRNIIKFLDPGYFSVYRNGTTKSIDYARAVLEDRLLAYFSLGKADHNALYKKVYKLWQKEGTYYGLASRLRISQVGARSLIRHIEENGLVNDFHKPARQLTLAKKKQILEVYALLNKLGTLEAVGQEKGLTRERIRQILEKGNEYGIINYKASVIRKFDELANNISKTELEQLIIEQGSISKTIPLLKNKYGDAVNENRISSLIGLYNINLRELYVETQRRQCLADYNEIVQILGHHPSTTELSKRADGLLLWRRIYRLWGRVDNFRKEFGIIVQRKPLPPSSNGLKASLERSKKRKQERKQKAYEIILQSGPIAVKDIAVNMDIGVTTLSIYLKELREEKLVKWSHIGNRSIYSASTPKQNGINFE